MYITPSPPSDPLFFPSCSTPIQVVSHHKNLGVVLDSSLTWNHHVDHLCKRTSSATGVLQSHFSHLPIECKLLFYRLYILPLFDYCDTAWSGMLSCNSDKLEVHHRRILKLLFGKSRHFASHSLYALAHTTSLCQRRNYHLCVLIHKILLGLVPFHLNKYNWFSLGRRTRSSLSLPRSNTSLFLRSPFFSGYSLWSSLPIDIRSSPNIHVFKHSLQRHWKI